MLKPSRPTIVPTRFSQADALFPRPPSLLFPSASIASFNDPISLSGISRRLSAPVNALKIPLRHYNTTDLREVLHCPSNDVHTTVYVIDDRRLYPFGRNRGRLTPVVTKFVSDLQREPQKSIPNRFAETNQLRGRKYLPS
jgi:hypothetical protein